MPLVIEEYEKNLAGKKATDKLIEKMFRSILMRFLIWMIFMKKYELYMISLFRM